MNVHDTIRADEIEVGDQILITRIIKHATVQIPFIVHYVLVEGTNVMLRGESLDKNANDAVVLWSDENVDVWAV
jgi:hypothetical protein